VQNRRLISNYRSDTDQKLEDINRIATKPETFNATRCSSCGRTLDLPTVHFLCKHSFHQSCLNPVGDSANDLSRGTPSSVGAGGFIGDSNLIGETSSVVGGIEAEDGKPIVECPLCAPQNAMVRSMRKAQEDSAGMHDLFLDELGKSRERFGTIAEWFGRGVMNGQSGE
jgi:hypothetical protein